MKNSTSVFEEQKFVLRVVVNQSYRWNTTICFVGVETKSNRRWFVFAKKSVIIMNDENKETLSTGPVTPIILRYNGSSGNSKHRNVIVLTTYTSSINLNAQRIN